MFSYREVMATVGTAVDALGVIVIFVGTLIATTRTGGSLALAAAC